MKTLKWMRDRRRKQRGGGDKKHRNIDGKVRQKMETQKKEVEVRKGGFRAKEGENRNTSGKETQKE